MEWDGLCPPPKTPRLPERTWPSECGNPATRARTTGAVSLPALLSPSVDRGEPRAMVLRPQALSWLSAPSKARKLVDETFKLYQLSVIGLTQRNGCNSFSQLREVTSHENMFARARIHKSPGF